jgi:hypothetical protein
MSQPVKLSDALVLDARIAGEAQERSIAGQVEFWAKLGRATELLLDGRKVMTLRMNAGAQPLSEALASVETPEGRRRIAEVLANRPYPHYRQYSGQPGLLVRIDESGTETVGRFVNRVFVAVEAKADSKGQPFPETKPRTAKKKSRTRAVPTGFQAKARIAPKEQKAWA